MKIHFVGIGGIGMSALADIQLDRHNIVTGSDLRLNNLTDDLSRKGAKIFKGHSAENIAEDIDFVVKSTCIKNDNPEMERARALGLNIISRGELLKNIMEEFPVSVAVTGTHGKTTTSSLISHIAECGGAFPTVIVGGEMRNFNSNSKTGKGGMIVAELDESDGYFRNVRATCAVVTNVEREHMEHYSSWENLLDAYREFIEKTPADGLFIYNGQDEVLKNMARTVRSRKLAFGIDGSFDISCRAESYAKSIEFELMVAGRRKGTFSSGLIGRHNLMNNLAAIAAGLELGISYERIMEAVKSFKGVKRRFDLAGTVNGIKVIEDYAHHPTEIRSVITAARDWSKGRIITIFQPHRYSRTQDLLHEFADCFYKSDMLILTEIYSADEDELREVSAKDIFSLLDKNRFESLNFSVKENIPGYVSKLARENDTILILGAGDIREIAKDIIAKLNERFKDG